MNVHEYVESYEFRGDQDYTPNDREKVLIEDAIAGYLGLMSDKAAEPSLWAQGRTYPGGRTRAEWDVIAAASYARAAHLPED